MFRKQLINLKFKLQFIFWSTVHTTDLNTKLLCTYTAEQAHYTLAVAFTGSWNQKNLMTVYIRMSLKTQIMRYTICAKFYCHSAPNSVRYHQLNLKKSFKVVWTGPGTLSLAGKLGNHLETSLFRTNATNQGYYHVNELKNWIVRVAVYTTWKRLKNKRYSEQLQLWYSYGRSRGKQAKKQYGWARTIELFTLIKDVKVIIVQGRVEK